MTGTSGLRRHSAYDEGADDHLACSGRDAPAESRVLQLSSDAQLNSVIWGRPFATRPAASWGGV